MIIYMPRKHSPGLPVRFYRSMIPEAPAISCLYQ